MCQDLMTDAYAYLLDIAITTFATFLAGSIAILMLGITIRLARFIAYGGK